MMMSITTVQKATIIEIDERVKEILDNDGTVDNILLGMQAYMPYVIDMIGTVNLTFDFGNRI